MRSILLAAVLSPLVLSLPAQQPARDTASAPNATAVRAPSPPVIDGRDDEAVWHTAPVTRDFLEFTPNEGKRPRFETSFRVAYDDRNLYVFVRAFDPHPDSIMTALTRRDVRGPSDQLKVMVDAYHDRRSGFEFAVNPLGVKRDYAMYNDTDEDDSWDGVWDVGTAVDSLGWTAEFRIPFSQLRYANQPEHTFGFAIWRDIERYKERASWPLYSSRKNATVSQLGTLTGIRDITPFHRLEITPYTVARTSTMPVTSALDGQSPWGQTRKVSVGADLKYGVTPNLTLDATVNPDFGQVEADPSEVNLSAFETFFQERRPFFIEGTGLYRFDVNCSIVNCNGEGLFYTRRIGRTPQLFGLYADQASPNVSPILGAAKLTGKVAGSLNVGVLEAVTGRVGGTFDRTTEPRTSYTVLRAQQDLRNGETSIGVIGTGVRRALDQWSEDFLRKDAYVGGANLRHRWGTSQWELQANATRSVVNGSAATIAATQRSSVHLFQRPDAGLGVDPTRTSLVGDEEEVTFGKMGGGMVHWQTAWDRRSPGYEINDLGFMRRANQQTFSNWMGLNFNKPTRAYRRMSGNFNAWTYWTDSDHLVTERAVNTNWHVTLPNNMGVHTGVTAYQLGQTFCDNCARGGPAMRVSPGLNWNFNIFGDDRRRVVPGLGLYSSRSDDGRSDGHGFGPQVTVIPMSQLQLDFSADWRVNHDDRQWIGNFDDAGGVRHYAFARLTQETRSVGIRASYTATPTLSFQLYTAPFVSRGTFTDARELSATPRADRYDDRFARYAPPAGATNGFDVVELKSNSVVRWEFRPGSTVFAVWTHGRGGYDEFRDRTWGSEYRDLLALHPTNTFLLKVAYWLNAR